jgi:hypothetical protein
MGARLVAGGHIAAVEGGRRPDPVGKGPGGAQGDGSAHAVAGDSHLARLHVRVLGQEVEAGRDVGHLPPDAGAAAQPREQLHRRRIPGPGGGDVEGRIGSGAPEQVRQHHDISRRRQPLAHLEQGRADRRRIHQHDRPRPGALARLGLEDEGAGVAVGVGERDFGAAHLKSVLCENEQEAISGAPASRRP